MSGTKTGAQKARDTNLAKYGKDFYVKMGRLGGSKPREYYRFRDLKEKDPDLLRQISAKGGVNSRRHKK